MSINKRIELIIKELGYNPNSFSNTIGVSPTVIHNIIKGRNAPGFDVISKIVSSFDNISIDWLIKGVGDMLEVADELPEVSEPLTGYCKLCQEKDKVIAAQQAQIATQSEYIELLKEQSPQNSGQKRKAS